eukprot:TRINITY_DN14832_c4_g1_i1.p1 TRINITY_DN14832_c4_g1~~TRINITY_DN14832_c4_g1_i1.p1  ORF type:complete len:252 (+),score=38.40 TRINITY_DN14832_c4_g1_i1:191-946(+)
MMKDPDVTPSKLLRTCEARGVDGEKVIADHVMDMEKVLQEKDSVLQVLTKTFKTYEESQTELAAKDKNERGCSDPLPLSPVLHESDTADVRTLKRNLKGRCKQITFLMSKVTSQAAELSEFEHKIAATRGELGKRMQEVKRQGDVLKSQEGQLHELIELIGQHQETLEGFSEADKQTTAVTQPLSRVEKSLVNLEERATKLEKKHPSDDKNTTDSSSSTSGLSYFTRQEGSDGSVARRHIRMQNNLVCSVQ